jgi:hypothetical protein
MEILTICNLKDEEIQAAADAIHTASESLKSSGTFVFQESKMPQLDTRRRMLTIPDAEHSYFGVFRRHLVHTFREHFTEFSHFGCTIDPTEIMDTDNSRFGARIIDHRVMRGCILLLGKLAVFFDDGDI